MPSTNQSLLSYCTDFYLHQFIGTKTFICCIFCSTDTVYVTLVKYKLKYDIMSCLLNDVYTTFYILYNNVLMSRLPNFTA
jgi:hypothetical protein